MQRITITAGTGFDRNGHALDAQNIALALAGIRAELARRFGGYTETDSSGGWINGSGELVVEPGRRWIVVTDMHSPYARIAAEETAAFAAALLRQESVLLELDSPAVAFVGAPEQVATAAA